MTGLPHVISNNIYKKILLRIKQISRVLNKEPIALVRSRQCSVPGLWDCFCLCNDLSVSARDGERKKENRELGTAVSSCTSLETLMQWPHGRCSAPVLWISVESHYFPKWSQKNCLRLLQGVPLGLRLSWLLPFFALQWALNYFQGCYWVSCLTLDESVICSTSFLIWWIRNEIRHFIMFFQKQLLGFFVHVKRR